MSGLYVAQLNVRVPVDVPSNVNAARKTQSPRAMVVRFVANVERTATVPVNVPDRPLLVPVATTGAETVPPGCTTRSDENTVNVPAPVAAIVPVDDTVTSWYVTKDTFAIVNVPSTNSDCSAVVAVVNADEIV